MDKEIILTPEQLYFIGRFVQAKYIDYAYVAALKDINQNFSLFETEAKASLVSAGILTEDFGGNVEVDPTVLKLLKPIFFGETETAIDICTIDKEKTITAYKYHFYDGTVTMVTGESGKLLIKAADQFAIQKTVESLISDTYDAEIQTVETIDKDHITRVITFKHIQVGVTSTVKIYIEANHIFYHEQEGSIESVTKSQFITEAFDLVKGV